MGCMEMYDDRFEICPHCGYCDGDEAEEAIHIDPGTLLHNRYIIGKVIGYGGFGVTYIGWDGKLQIKVAIKEYFPSEFSSRIPGQSVVTVFGGEKHQQFYDGLNKFVDEAKRLAQFQSESGIVKIFDSFTENDTAYIIMEYLEGETLGTRLERDGIISEEETVKMLMPVMNSLKAVHEQGIIHRDIAPDNIFITRDGDVKLIDFGASRYATTSHSRSLTVVVKQGYSPEEQYRSRGDQGPHTDVYALAATMYKMITGKTPPDAMERRSRKEGFNKEILVEPHIANKAANISVKMENALLNAMNIRIEDRTPDIQTFINELTGEKPAKRRVGRIKKIDVYRWPLWAKILVPTALCAALVFGGLLVTGVISFKSPYTTEIVVPDGYVVVPDVESLNRDEAIQKLESSKLLPVVSGNVESEYIVAGKIVLQTPIGESYLKINGTVELMLSSGNGIVTPLNGIATMPFILGDSQENAVAKLAKAGLAEPDVEYEYSDSVKEGCVISASEEYGTELPENSKITMTVSKGPKAFKMPDVVGKSKSEAEKLLSDAKLVINLTYAHSDAEAVDTVIKQSVAPDSDVKIGQEITLTLATDRKTVTVPNVVGVDPDNAKKKLEAVGLKVVVNTDNGTGNVKTQEPAAGESTVEGETVVIKLGTEVTTTAKTVFTVTFDANGGTVNTASASVTDGDAYGTLPIPTRTGFKFAGWTTAKNGGTAVGSSTKVTGSHTLYASWTAEKYTVNFDANGGSCSESSRSVTFMAQYGNLPSASRSGYVFAGWYTAKSGGNAVTANSSVSIAGNHTLYAHWSTNSYTLTFNANGGSVSTASKKLAYGAGYGDLPTPKRDYYTFSGWFTANNGGTQVSSSTKMGTSDVTVYAHWTANSTSGWVLASSVSSGAKVVDHKWTYTYTENTESDKTSLNGWTQTGSYWSKTNSGTWYYGSYPSGFNTNNGLYSKYNKKALSASENATSKRSVSGASFHTYIYWHWTYELSGYHSEGDRRIADTYNEWISGGGHATVFEAFENSTNYSFNSGANAYKIKGHSTYSYWWLKQRVTIYKQTYTDYKKIFKYQKVTTQESTSKVEEGNGISDIKEYVRYIAK